MDTPVVNGTAYPVLEVEPKAYRLRILNAAHDRFFNLSIFKADTVTLAPVDHCTGVGPTVPCDQRTEVAMVDATGTLPGWPATWPADGRPGGVPDWTKAGPAWLQIGTEGGFLPRPVTIPPQPVTWNNDVTTFNAGNVNGGSLILGPAERADVVVDFTAYAGQTLILYNAAPAPWPALDPHYDYFTGAPDMTEAGGAAPTLPGLGPNTRTVMKIVVKGVATVPSTFSASELDKAFTGTRAAGTFSAGATAFGQGQDPLIVGQGNLNPTADPAHYEAFLFDQDYSAISSIYGSFPTVWPDWGVARINDKALHFIGTNGDTTYTFNAADTATHPLDNSVKLYGGIPMMFKAIQDEQGETFDDYGRMRAGLGLEMLNAGAGQVNFIIQTYSDPSTEILEENGIQVWKITHNGVDTHPIHFHLYDVQVINRVGWDGFIRLPDPNELGWKDTLRVSPLEDTIVALRPVTPRLPFGVPESKRPLNPARPIGDPTELTQIDPFTGNARNNLNRFENLDWEYVWHCHILSHEENDMMRNQSFLFQETVPDAPEPLNLAGGTTAQVDLAWTDPTPVNFATLAGFGDPKGEIGFRVERSPAGANTFTPLATVLANATTYSDTTVASGTSYDYRVVAYNAAGDSLPSSTVTVAAQTYYTVAVSAGAGGSVTPAGPSVVVPANGSQTFDIAPATGYHIVGITVDGTPMGALTSHTFSNVTANHTLAAEFAINTYTITATAGANGSIDPVGATTVNYGGSQAYTITPATGYHVVDVTVDGVSVGALTGYTFSNVTADRTIAATFAINTYTLTATAGTGGTITPADATTVNYGGSQAYTIAPAAGYLISDVLVDGVSQGVITSYTFSNVTADHAIAATFIPIAVAPATLTVPATVTANHDVPVTADASPTPGAVYSFEYSGNNGATWTAGPSGTAASVTITVPANGSYLFRVSVTATGYARSAYTQSSACTVNANAQPAAALTVPAISNDGSIPLSWTASATPGVTYLLYESKNGGAYSQVASTTATAATLTGRTNGTYTYQVKAVATGWGDSTLANGSNACVVTLIAQPVPALTVPATSTDGTIAISWTSSPTPGVTYQLYQSKNGGAYALVATTTATSVTLTGRTNGSHVFRIKATLAGWADSSWTTGSNACVVTLTVQPVASLTVPAASNDGTIFLQWAASATPGVTYQVQQSRNGGPYALVASITGTSVALNGRTDGTYTYRVRAIKSGWVSTSWTDGSNPCVVTRVVQPVALLNVPATSAGSIALTWTASPTSGVTYQLYESRNGGAYTQLTGTTATSRTLTGRTAGSYTYQIRAVKAGWAPSTMTDGSNPCVVGVP
jgi:FtsP/CotA-like multicopper oxidase with cupredoxin domain